MSLIGLGRKSTGTSTKNNHDNQEVKATISDERKGV